MAFYLNSTNQINYTASNISSVYNVTLTNLAAGNYSFQWFANDTAGNQNFTSIFNFTKNQASPGLNLSFNTSQGIFYQDILVENGTFVNITATANAEGIIILYLNDTAINSGLNLISNRTQINVTLNATAFYNATQNYSSSSITRLINIEISGTAPRVSKISPANASYATNSTVTFRINVTSAALQNVTIYVWNVTNSSLVALLQNDLRNITGMFIDTNWSYNLSDGIYMWNVMATDSFNNINNSLDNFTFIVDTAAPSITPSFVTAIYNDETTTVRCSATDTNFWQLLLIIGGTQRNSTTMNGTSISYVYPGTNGTAIANCTAYDLAGFANSYAATITVSTRPSSTSTSSTPRSSAGTTPPATQPVIPAVTSTITAGEVVQTLSIVSNVPATITIPPAISAEGITQIQITTSSNVSNATINLIKVNAENISVKALGEVYNYFNITTNLNTSIIKNASIDFAVNKSWVENSSINISTIKLNRYKDNWTELITAKSSEDNKSVYFKAETPGFSLFAITAEKNAIAPEKPKTKTWIYAALGIAVLALIILILIITGIIKFPKKTSKLGAIA
jgi:PGF-pre-PGF domain-containing protein